MRTALNQRTRFILLILDVVILCIASWVAFSRIFPVGGDKGFWFYTALLGLIFGSRLETPFFAKPADVVLYAAPAAIALVLGNSWEDWSSGVRVAYSLAMTFCILIGMTGAVERPHRKCGLDRSEAGCRGVAARLWAAVVECGRLTVSDGSKCRRAAETTHARHFWSA